MSTNESKSKRRRLDQESSNEQDDHSYFGAYANIDIHEEMLADKTRTNAYRLAILRNYESIYGKTVLDIGAGTGILSLFCVQAGAKKVYALEASDLALYTREVVKANKMEHKIEVIQGKAEDVELPAKVDVIVSEWMGYFLLYESMLQTVITVRDKWLKEDGLMLPGFATLYMAPFSNTEEHRERAEFWEETMAAYKVNLSPMIPYAYKCAAQSIAIRDVPGEQVQAHATEICHLDLSKVTHTEIERIKKTFCFKCFGHAEIHGLVSWFDVKFSKDVTLSTSPYKETTHWQQSVMYFDEPFSVEQDSEIEGSITIAKNNKYSRFLDIDVDYCLLGKDRCKKHYLMNDLLT